MENPATWGEAEKVVDRVLKDFHAYSYALPARAGLSLTRQITDALRDAHLLKEVQE